MEENLVSLSPVAGTPEPSSVFKTAANLTGLPRRCKDNCVDTHNTIQKWNSCNIKCLALIKEIMAIRAEELRAEEDECGEEKPEKSFQFCENLHSLCERCLNIHKRMVVLKEKLELLTSQFKAMAQLHDTDEVDAIVKRCYERSKIIFNEYNEEIELKKKILESAALYSNSNEMTFLQAAWVHQPFIKKAETFLQMMLMETGVL